MQTRLRKEGRSEIPVDGGVGTGLLARDADVACQVVVWDVDGGWERERGV